LPIANESAHKRLKMPQENPAFWIAIEDEKTGAVGYAAIGAFRQQAESAVH
jgi:hypothetical protein